MIQFVRQLHFKRLCTLSHSSFISAMFRCFLLMYRIFCILVTSVHCTSCYVHTCNLSVITFSISKRLLVCKSYRLEIFLPCVITFWSCVLSCIFLAAEFSVISAVLVNMSCRNWRAFSRMIVHEMHRQMWNVVLSWELASTALLWKLHCVIYNRLNKLYINHLLTFELPSDQCTICRRTKTYLVFENNSLSEPLNKVLWRCRYKLFIFYISPASE